MSMPLSRLTAGGLAGGRVAEGERVDDREAGGVTECRVYPGPRPQ